MRYATVGWLWYLATLLPVIGIVQVGGQAMADRYTYLPLTGIFIIVVYGISAYGETRAWVRKSMMAAAPAVLLVLAVLTWRQCQYWRSGLTLFGHAVAVTQRNYIAHNNYGVNLHEAGREEDAVKHYLKAVAIFPDHASAHNNIGVHYLHSDRYEEAARHFGKAVGLKPQKADFNNNYGVALAKMGRIEEAIRYISKAVSLMPHYDEARKNLSHLQGMEIPAKQP